MVSDSPGLFYFWEVRSTDSDDPGDIVEQPWRDRNFIYFGGPDYQRDPFVVTDLMVPGRKFAQVRMGVTDCGPAFSERHQWDTGTLLRQCPPDGLRGHGPQLVFSEKPTWLRMPSPSKVFWTSKIWGPTMSGSIWPRLCRGTSTRMSSRGIRWWWTLPQCVKAESWLVM